MLKYLFAMNIQYGLFSSPLYLELQLMVMTFPRKLRSN